MRSYMSSRKTVGKSSRSSGKYDCASQRLKQDGLGSFLIGEMQNVRGDNYFNLGLSIMYGLSLSYGTDDLFH